MNLYSIILIFFTLLLFCYPQRESMKYYVFTFENAAGYQHHATITKHLFDTENVFDSTGINIRPVGYKFCSLEVVKR
jgi:hypothetical protein